MAAITTTDTAEVAPAGRFQAMNGLRLLAAALIVLFHAASSGAGTGLDIDNGLGSMFSLFDVGVPIFFVLSGFLLYRPMVASRLTGARRKSVGRYAWHRFRRIVPAYLTVLFIVAQLDRAQMGRGDEPWRIAAFLQIYDPILFTGGLVVAWSLCTEVAFYVYLPIHDLFMRFSKGVPGKRVLDEWVACGALVAISLVFKLWMYSSGELTRSAYLFRFIDAFAIGMALAVLSVAESKRRRPGRLFTLLGKLGGLPWVAAAGLILVLSWYRFPTFPVAPNTLEGTGRDLVKLVVAALLIMPLVADQHGTSPLGRVMSTRAMRWWGELSYGIFLIHLPLLVWLQEELSQPPELLPTLWLGVVALAAATALAAVLYAVVEWPVQHIDPFRGRRRGGGDSVPAAKVDDRATATLPAGAGS